MVQACIVGRGAFIGSGKQRDASPLYCDFVFNFCPVSLVSDAPTDEPIPELRQRFSKHVVVRPWNLKLEGAMARDPCHGSWPDERRPTYS